MAVKIIQNDWLTVFENYHLQMFRAMQFEDLLQQEQIYLYLLNMDIAKNPFLFEEVKSALGLIRIEIVNRQRKFEQVETYQGGE